MRARQLVRTFRINSKTIFNAIDYFTSKSFCNATSKMRYCYPIKYFRDI